MSRHILPAQTPTLTIAQLTPHRPVDRFQARDSAGDESRHHPQGGTPRSHRSYRITIRGPAAAHPPRFGAFMIRQRLAILLVLPIIIAALAPSDATLAQQPLPAAIIQAQSLDAEAQKTIADYIAEPLRKLESAEFKELKSAREHLLEPLKSATISVAFRQEYAKGVLPRLAAVAAGKADLNSVNALRIMGEIGTSDALDELEKQAADQRIPVRYAALCGIERALQTLTLPAGVALAPGRAASAVTVLGTRVGIEPEPEVAEVAVRALSRMLSLDRAGFTIVREGAMTALAAGIRVRAAALAAKPIDSNLSLLVFAGTQARNAIAQASPQLQLSTQGRSQAAEIAGDILAAVVRAAKANQLGSDPNLRSLAARAVDTAESAILLIANRATSATSPGADLAKATPEGDKAFFDKAVTIFGVLSEPPLAFPPDRFLK